MTRASRLARPARLRACLALVLLGAATLAAAAPLPAHAQSLSFSCPEMAGFTLATDGGPVVYGPPNGWIKYCVWDKGQPAVATLEGHWVESPGSEACPFLNGVTYHHDDRGGFDGGIVSQTRIAYVTYGVLPVGEGQKEDGRAALPGLAQSLFAEIEGRAAPCPAAPPPVEGRCRVFGVVRDRTQQPLTQVHVTLEKGNEVRDLATGTDGSYSFGAIDPASTDELRVTISFEEWQDTPHRYRVMVGPRVAAIHSDRFHVDDANDCKRDFFEFNLGPGYEVDLSHPVPLEVLFETYQSLGRAWQLQTMIGRSIASSSQLPIPVYVWCLPADSPVSCPTKDHGRAWFSPATSPPHIALSPEYSSLDDDRLQDVIYHEFGHAFMYLAWGDFPDRSVFLEHQNHAGYYVNGSSEDALVEGWATFYKAMVHKHVLGTNLRRLERSPMPWDGGGSYEEYALAGLLFDVEDAATPGANGRSINNPRMWREPGGLAFAVEVPSDVPVGEEWRATFKAGDPAYRVYTVGGRVRLRDGHKVGVGEFLTEQPWRASLLETGPDPIPDDDPFAEGLASLWQAVGEHRNSPLFGNGVPIRNVTEVGLALRDAFPGDRDGNGVDDVTQLLVDHGYFSDIANNTSDHVHQPDELVGPSSHFGTTINNVRYGDRIPRNTDAYEAPLSMAIDTGGVAATALVQISPDEDSPGQAEAFDLDLAEDGRYHFPGPPPRDGARIAVVMLADGYLPAAALDLSADEFWQHVNADPDAQFLVTSVRLQAGMIEFEDTASAAGAGRGLVLAVILGAAAAAGLLVVLLVRRRRRAPA